VRFILLKLFSLLAAAYVLLMNTPAPIMMVMGSLIGHLVYGVVLGVMITEEPEPARVK